MIDGVKRAEVLLFSFFFLIHIQLQSEAAKAVDAVRRCLARSLAHTHTHENA